MVSGGLAASMHPLRHRRIRLVKRLRATEGNQVLLSNSMSP